MDLLVALIPAVMWGIMPLVVSKIGGKPYQQTLGVTFGAFIFAIGMYFYSTPQFTGTILLVSFVSGIFWTVGQLNQFRAFTHIGVSKAMPLSTGMQLVGTSLFGVFVFQEWGTTAKLVLGFSALVFIIVGISLTSYQQHKSKGNNMKQGMVALIISSLGYVAYVVILRAFNISGWEAILPQAVGMVIAAIAFSFKDRKTFFLKETWLSIIPGVIWSIGNLALLISNTVIGVAISFSLSQMGVVISTLGGILLLGEKKTKRELILVIIGIILVGAGGFMIGLTK
ncbi:glucose transporter GlcU [Listeria rocourtiae]|uniref:GRP family sugar transporter n=1 Tax=Listeria rocourtiae TaxID=647910 RepID=UPI0016296875|nr:GRP family sugar transporter [Listeria rocourtiae]MBC1606068.1 glucose transporter GlcU [Listeria rocourtiae]